MGQQQEQSKEEQQFQQDAQPKLRRPRRRRRRSSSVSQARRWVQVDRQIINLKPASASKGGMQQLNEMSMLNHHVAKVEEKEDGGGGSGVCVICMDASSEAVCVPCGHVAGCVSCLKEIQDKNSGCPVCRANIDQVIKLYHV